MATALVSPRQERAKLKLRQNASLLTADELAAFRAALTASLARNDNLGYQFYASWHGVSLWLCEHHNELFLPWHRGYLYHIELALQDHDPSVTLPWWDWMDEGTIPAPYDVDGDVLNSVPIRPFNARREPDWPDVTDRTGYDGPPPKPLAPPLRPRYDWIMEAPTYTEFNRRLWFLHDNIHVWVSGTMGDPSWAAFDPLFWAHHAMVDRLWRIWQHNHPGALPPQSVLDRNLTYPRSPSFEVRELLDVKQLGFDYAGMTASVPGTI